jgi:hypothetical protein
VNSGAVISTCLLLRMSVLCPSSCSIDLTYIPSVRDFLVALSGRPAEDSLENQRHGQQFPACTSAKRDLQIWASQKFCHYCGRRGCSLIGTRQLSKKPYISIIMVESLKTETAGSSETLLLIDKIHGVTSQKALKPEFVFCLQVLFIFFFYLVGWDLTPIRSLCRSPRFV